MTRIGCRAHDYGKLPAAELAAVLHAKGYTGAQLAMPRGIAGIADFAHITEEQLAEIRTAFAAQDVEISVLSCYQDLSAPDADARRAAVDAVKRTLGYAKVLGAKMVGSETAWGPCTDEEKAARRPLMLDSIARITEEAARLDAVFAVESVDVHPLCTPELLREVLDAAADGLNACVVHPSGILGPNDPAIGQTTRTLIQILNGEMPIGMQGSFNLVDVRDLAAGTIAAADRGRKGECYILSNDEVSLKELCEMLKAETGCRGCLFYLPLSLAHFAAKLMEARAAKTGKPAVLTEFAVYNLERNNHFDCSKAKNELGFAPRPYKETLHDLAVWLKQEGKIA